MNRFVEPASKLGFLLVFLLQGNVVGQDLNLFEEIETNSSANGDIRDRGRENNAARGNNRVTNSTPEFTLIGTSRIGSKYSAIIQHRDGETLVVHVAPDTNTEIPGHTDFAIVEVSAGTASIRYPQNIPCVEFQERGVSCNSAANIAALSLASAAPVIRSSIAGSNNLNDNNADGAESSVEAGEDPPKNPFEALRAQQGNNATINAAGDAGRFTPRRIAPEDVPPGMRVVSTPFGDRLVEQ